jgi:hypothetical protein
MTSLVEHLKQWSEDIQLEARLNELKPQTHLRYQHFAKHDANKADDSGNLKIHRAWSGNFDDDMDDSHGKEDFAKRDKRNSGIERSKRLQKKQKKEPLLKPVTVAKEPDLVQRVKKLAGLS